MQDVINLLPDSVANQIAAGEVIQRPASAVKELLENALDAGADSIKLVIKDAGKTLIQVIDNGCGMSPMDARMCFERHATSKISKADDLFAIRTMGFRGEALASIAAIAHVDLKTKRFADEMGTHIVMEGSDIKSQTAEALTNGTVFSVKNLYFNVPARRNFLKSNPIESRHIVDEFTRVAMMNPSISFTYIDDERQKFLLSAGSLKQRIAALMGKNYNEKLLKVEEKTEILSLNGFVGKPEIAKKTRGEQFLFVNKRFIKHSYLNHAIVNAYEEMIPNGYFPSYFINFDIDPAQIDVNIHPTKTEVNFQDERVIYSILRSAVKMSLGKYTLSPQFEFDEENILSFGPPPPLSEIKQPVIKVNPEYNPFESNNASAPKSPSSYGWNKPQPMHQNWEKLYEGLNEEVRQIKTQLPEIDNTIDIKSGNFDSKIFQLDRKYIITTLKSGIAIVNQQGAHERILYDKFSEQISQGRQMGQRLLFPENIHFSPSDIELLAEIYEDLLSLGFEITRMQDTEFQITAIPSDLLNENPQHLIEQLLEQFKNHQMMLRIDKRQNILLSMAKNLAIKAGTEMNNEQMQQILKDLFISSSPEISPFGKKIIEFISSGEISQRFN